MKKKYCVCTEQASDTNSYSLCILKKFDTEKEAVDCIESGRLGFADFYYVMPVWFRK